MCITLWLLLPVYVGSLRARTRRNSIVESCKGHSTLPPKPFGHLKNQRDTHYMNTHNLCGSAFGNGETMRSFRIFSHHTAPFKHWRPSSNLPETYWLLSNVLCWCHMSTIFHSHPSKISALSKSHTKLYVLLHTKQPKFYCWKAFNYGRESHRKHMM